MQIFIILKSEFNEVNEKDILKTKVLQTFVDVKKVHKKEFISVEMKKFKNNFIFRLLKLKFKIK